MLEVPEAPIELRNFALRKVATGKCQIILKIGEKSASIWVLRNGGEADCNQMQGSLFRNWKISLKFPSTSYLVDFNTVPIKVIKPPFEQHQNLGKSEKDTY